MVIRILSVIVMLAVMQFNGNAIAFELLHHKGDTYYYRCDDGRVLARKLVFSANKLIRIHRDSKQGKVYFQAPDGRIAVRAEMGALPGSVPDYKWYYGCAPTSAGMMLGYYDRNGYNGKGYSSLVPGGVAELDTFSGSNQIVLDTMASKEHIADYYVHYGDSGNDPNPGGHQDNCLADFMETSKDSADNRDGGTNFWYWQSGDPFTLADVEKFGEQDTSAIYGIYEWIKRQGYNVNSLQNQYIDSKYSGGCTFNDFVKEIDAGRPAIIHVTGHVMLAYGYAKPNTVYVRDTWQQNANNAMTWGGSYNSDQGPLDHEAMTFMTLSGGESTSANHKLYYPHIASDNSWGTEIAFINTSNDYLDNIELLAMDDAGATIAGKKIYSLKPHGRKEIDIASEYGSSASKVRQIVLSSTSDAIKGYLKFYINGSYRVAIPAIKTIGPGILYVPHIASDSDWWTGISLVNTGEDYRTISIIFNDGGAKLVDLPPKAHRAFTVRSLFNGQAQPNLKWAAITGAKDIAGLQLFGSGNQLSGNLLFDHATKNMYFPHIASDTTWWTGIAACNSGNSGGNITIRPYTASGTELTPQMLTIDAGSKYLGTVTQLELPAGTAWFGLQSSVDLTGLELFGTNSGKQLAGYGCVDIQSVSGIFPKIDKTGWTGIAFVNANANQTNIALTAYDDNGNTVATSTLSLAGHEKKVDMADKLFNTSIANATYIQFTSSLNVVGFQLNGSSDNTMLDALPTL